jgi:molybdopterin/thiamine biosynthesis adenylyltransferase
MARFTDEEVKRYARQMVLAQVGGVGQERLREAAADARSEVEALYLAAAGVGRLRVPSEAIAERVRALNPLVAVSVWGDALEDTVEQASERALQTIKKKLGL